MTFEETWDFLMADLPPGITDMKTLRAVMRAFYMAGETQGLRACGAALREVVAAGAPH